MYLKNSLKDPDKLFVILLVIAGYLFMSFLGQVHLFDWDEINFAESAREMIVSGDYLTVQIDYQAFWEKPPLFFWMQVVAMKIFGVNEFAARFPNAVCGLVSLVVLYAIGARIKNKWFGLLWMLVYMGSILPFFYFKSGIIDPWFNLFIFSGIYFCYLYFYGPVVINRQVTIILSGLCIGAAMLTKGPVALLVYMLVFLLYWIWHHFQVHLKFRDIGLFAVAVALIGGLWFIIQAINGNFDIIVDFIQYQVHLFRSQGAGHGGFPFYHVVVLFFGVYPASIFALSGFYHKHQSVDFSRFRTWMIGLFLIVLVLFSIVQTKIIHYSSLCYFPLTFIAAYVIEGMMQGRFRIQNYQKVLLLGMGLLWGTIVMVLPLIDAYKQVLLEKGFVQGAFARGNIQADVGWTGYEVLIGGVYIGAVFFIVLYLIRRYLKISIVALFFINALFIYFTVLFITPRIEAYTQREAISFYQKHQHEDCYFEPLGFKSYAHYFYGKVQPKETKKAYQSEWLLSGDIPKTAYFVCKKPDKEKFLDQYPELQKLYEKNGFVFMVRYPDTSRAIKNGKE